MIQKPRGTQDIFEDKVQIWKNLESLFYKIISNFNYNEIRTPIFESKELFEKTSGPESEIIKKEMYNFFDKKNREFVLRPEGTAPVVRSIIENKLYINEKLPLKLFYIQSMFRYERPQVGRTRQFHQLGVENFGVDSLYQDIEILILANTILEELHLAPRVNLEINYLIFGEEREVYIKDLKNALINLPLCKDCKFRINHNTLRVLDCKVDQNKFTDIPEMTAYLSETQKLRFEKTLDILQKMNIKFSINPKLVRGLDYYTGLVFEFKFQGSQLGNQQTLIAGGRYNELVKSLGGPKLPAVGFGLGIERIILCLEKEKIVVAPRIKNGIYISCLNENAFILTQKVLKLLRDNDFRADMDYSFKGIKYNFNQADKLGSEWILVIGDKEVKTLNFQIKNLITKKTKDVNLENILEKLWG